jgi:hypothetical protein
MFGVALQVAERLAALLSNLSLEVRAPAKAKNSKGVKTK